MSTLMLLIIVWTVSYHISYRLLVAAWRVEFDVKKKDVREFRRISLLGPIMIGPALVIWLTDGRQNHKDDDDIVYPRKVAR